MSQAHPSVRASRGRGSKGSKSTSSSLSSSTSTPRCSRHYVRPHQRAAICGGKMVALHSRRIAFLVLLAGAAGCSQQKPADRAHASGYAEATEVRLAPEVGGRILEMTLDEGDQVKEG